MSQRSRAARDLACISCNGEAGIRDQVWTVELKRLKHGAPEAVA